MVKNIGKLEEFVYLLVTQGVLEIDQQGRIWRVAATRGKKNGGTMLVPCERRRAEHPTKTYLQVRAMIDGERKHALAHRLVYRHFFGEISEGLTINHLNGDKCDNRPENLELATHSEQAIHARQVLKRGIKDQFGEKNAMSRLTSEQVATIRARRNAGETLAAIAKDFPVEMQTISKIVRNERWAE